MHPLPAIRAPEVFSEKFLYYYSEKGVMKRLIALILVLFLAGCGSEKEITLEYEPYQSTELGITFEHPSGWEMETTPNSVLFGLPMEGVRRPASIGITVAGPERAENYQTLDSIQALQETPRSGKRIITSERTTAAGEEAYHILYEVKGKDYFGEYNMLFIIKGDKMYSMSQQAFRDHASMRKAFERAKNTLEIIS